jgi:DNA-binding transcriptional ArsR family regulator
VAEIENQASRNRTGWRSPHPTPAGDQAPRRTLTDENRAVLDLMRRGERLTVEQIVIRAGMTRPAARGQLKKLVGMGLVSMARVNGQLWTYEKIGRG